MNYGKWWGMSLMKNNFEIYNIDLPLLIKAMNYYQSAGYTPLSVPMIVSHEAIGVTLPSNIKAKQHCDGLLNGFYVGSAEQSAYQMLADDSYISGKFMMLTPCQRSEAYLDCHHMETFLKLELVQINTNICTPIIDDVFSFLKKEFSNSEIEIVEDLFGNSSKDINVNGVEVGSYGYRNFEGNSVQYGTGLALPRISQAINSLLRE